MPTPRFASQVSKQIRVQDTVNAQGAWVGGTVVAVTGAINAQYQIYLDDSSYVFASSTLDTPIIEGDRVFVVKTGFDALIVGV